MTAPRRTAVVETLLMATIALAATYPTFIGTFRSMVFQTVPRDDYAPYLLHLAGRGGEVPGAPHAYRVLSVAAALPAFYALPAYRFSRLGDVDPQYLQATEALAFVSWIALAALGVMTYRIARDRLGATRSASAAVLLATLLFARYTSVSGVDPLAMLLIGAAVYWLERPWVFAGIVVASAGFNEKVWIVSALLVGARVLQARAIRPYRVHLLACAVAIAAYATSAAYFRSSGVTKPAEPRPVVSNAPLTVKATVTAKGVAQNAMPIALCVAACALSTLLLRGYRGPYWSAWDIAVPIGLATIGVAVNVGYTLGRLVFHAIPVILPPLALALDGGASARRAGGRLREQLLDEGFQPAATRVVRVDLADRA
jgi:hypothetical protein